MEGAIRVNTLVEETAEAVARFHAAVTGTVVLRRKTNRARLAASPAA
jgi:hypothetical protein